MTISLVVLHIGGAVALLLWAIRMVRTGVERSQLAVLRRFLRPRSRSRLRFALGGMAAAVLLQARRPSRFSPAASPRPGS